LLTSHAIFAIFFLSLPCLYVGADPRNILLFLVLIAEQLYLATDRGRRNEIIPAFLQLIAAGLFAGLSNWADVRFTVLSFWSRLVRSLRLRRVAGVAVWSVSVVVRFEV
jgi:hypothetical protein